MPSKKDVGRLFKQMGYAKDDVKFKYDYTQDQNKLMGTNSFDEDMDHGARSDEFSSLDEDSDMVELSGGDAEDQFDEVMGIENHEAMQGSSTSLINKGAGKLKNLGEDDVGADQKLFMERPSSGKKTKLVPTQSGEFNKSNNSSMVKEED